MVGSKIALCLEVLVRIAISCPENKGNKIARACGKLFIMYKNIESLCCIPETNIIL